MHASAVWSPIAVQLVRVAPQYHQALLHRGNLGHELTALQRRAGEVRIVGDHDLQRINGWRDARSGRVQGRPRSLHSHLGCNNDDIIIVLLLAIDIAIDAGIFVNSCEHKLCIRGDSIVHML